MAYVDTEKVLETARGGCHSDFGRSMADLTSLREVLEDTPTADVEEVRHGKWKKEQFLADVCGEFRCSLCGFTYCEADPEYPPHKYCPYCGAKMDGKESD